MHCAMGAVAQFSKGPSPSRLLFWRSRSPLAQISIWTASWSCAHRALSIHHIAFKRLTHSMLQGEAGRGTLRPWSKGATFGPEMTCALLSPASAQVYSRFVRSYLLAAQSHVLAHVGALARTTMTAYQLSRPARHRWID